MRDSARMVVDQKSRVTPRIGRYVGNEGNLALVDMGDQRVPVLFATPWVPQINEPVWVDTVDGQSRLVGPTTPKPGVGVVVTMNESTMRATVVTDFGEHVLPVAPTDPLPTSGDMVGIVWSSSPWCTILVDVPEQPDAPPPPPGGDGQVFTATFNAVDAGTTHSNGDWWQAQPWAAVNNYGAWFYGPVIKDTIPASAQFVSLEVYADYVQRQGSAPNWALHSSQVKSGVPTFGAATAWAPAEGFQSPPGGLAEVWFNALKAGGPAWGIGLVHGGYNMFASRVQNGATGALRIRWKV